MAIKDLYNEAKANKVDDKMYSMPLEDFIDEHKCLIKTLREGSREELLAEAEDQEKELEECLKEHGLQEDEEGVD